MRMLEIFSGGCEPEVEGDGSRVVAVGKRETAIYLERWCRRWWKPVSCQCGYPRKCIRGHGSTHGMHSVQVEAHRLYASISPKAELKVHVFLNVGHQQGCKVVT